MRSLFSGAQTFVSARFARGYLTSAKIPEALANEYVKASKELTNFGKMPLVPSSKAAEIGAQKFHKFLSEKDDTGFLQTLERFKNDPKNTAIFIEGVPVKDDQGKKLKEEIVSNFVISLARMIELEVPKPDSQSLFIVDSNQNREFLFPHVDQPLSEETPTYFALVSLESKNQKAKTYIIEADEIYKKLSSKAKEIFEDTEFKFKTPLSESDKWFKIFENKKGVLNINFDLDLRGFEVNFERSKFPQEDIKLAVQELGSITNELFDQGLPYMQLDEGTLGIVKNTRSMHARDELTTTGRRVLMRIYFDDMVKEIEVSKEPSAEIKPNKESEKLAVKNERIGLDKSRS